LIGEINTEIHAFLENIQAIDKKVNLTGIFLDLSKAYDVLNHEILLLKLNAYGIRVFQISGFNPI
jgi:hypothetical protein